MAVATEPPRLTTEALAVLCLYSFPGNVRELRSILLKAKALSGEGAIDRTGIEELLAGPSKSGNVLSALPAAPRDAVPTATPPVQELPTIQRAIENLVEEALRRSDGHRSKAAKLLGITPQALSQRLKHRGTRS